MAATVASLGSAFTTTAGNKTVTATPTNGDLIVVIATATGVTTTVADNATGGTYTQVDSTRTGFSTTGNLQMFVRDNLVSSASSTVYTATQTSSTGGGLVILRVTGMTLTGAAAVRSSGGQSTVAAGTPAPVLSLTPLSANPIITAMGNTTSTSTTNVVQRTGYTEDFDNGYNTPPTGLEVSHRASGETSATLTYGGATASQFASIAIELAYDTAPTVALNAPADTGTVATTTPQLTFTGTDADNDAVTYEVQVANYDQAQLTDRADKFLQATTSLQGQSFIPGASGNLVAVIMKGYHSSSGTILGTYTMKLYDSVPGGTFNLVATSDTISNSDIPSTTVPTAAADIKFNFSTPYSVTSGTTYYVQVQRDNNSGASPFLVLRSWDSASVYANGDLWLDVGGVATQFTGRDSYFKTFIGTYTNLDKLSNTDTGFVDITNGAHTDPFTSGEQIGYTIQAGDALTNGTTYFWQVRGKDPSGTNAYGAWATTQSFTVSSGTSATITQVAGTVTATGGTQTIATVNNVSLTQAAATVTATGGTQIVVGNVLLNATVTQVAATVTATGGTQSIATVNNVDISQIAATVTASGSTQVIASSQNAAITQVAGVVTATGGTQLAQTNSLNAQSAATVTASGGTQVITTSNFVAIAQVAATVTAGGGTQTIATVNDVSIAQLAATVTASGGTQAIATVNNVAISQLAGNVTATGGSQGVNSIQDASVTQLAGTVTATGGTQTVVTLQTVAITQVAANVTATGGTQVVQTNGLITQAAANVTATGGTQVIATVNNVSITQLAGSVTASGGTQTIATVNNSTVAQLAANVTVTGGTQTLTAMIDAAIAQQAANVTAAGGTQSIFASSGATNISIAQLAASVTGEGGIHVITTSTGPLPPVNSSAVIFLTGGQLAVRLSKSVYMPL